MRQVEEGAPEPAAPPPGPPPGWLAWENPWPWLAALALLVLAGVLIWLFLFNKSDRATVPRVVGLPQATAEKRVNDAGFDSTVVRKPAKAPRGTVFSQSPGAGTRLKKHQNVTLNVSIGPLKVRETTTPTTTTSATTTTAAPTVAMPNVVGRAQPDAGGAVQAAGLVADTYPAKGSQTAGVVVSETPSAGTTVKAGTIVRLNVSAGPGTQPATTVPNVTGQQAPAARDALWRASFTVRTIYRSSGGHVGAVIQQQPSGGGKAPRYTQITLYVGR